MLIDPSSSRADDVNIIPTKRKKMTITTPATTWLPPPELPPRPPPLQLPLSQHLPQTAELPELPLLLHCSLPSFLFPLLILSLLTLPNLISSFLALALPYTFPSFSFDPSSPSFFSFFSSSFSSSPFLSSLLSPLPPSHREAH